MVIITIIFGLVFFIMGINFYKGRWLDLLNGIDIKKVRDQLGLRKVVGMTYIIVGSILFLLALAYKANLLDKGTYLWILVPTVIVGPLIMTSLMKKYI